MEIRLEFPFTQKDTPRLRARIERDLRHVAQAVAEQDPHLDALVLTGGFSRGEGSARGDEPLNDYDLVAVRRRPGGRARYQALAHELSEEVGLEVDLMPVWRRRLRRVSPKLFWLDVRLGGRVIAGNERTLGDVPAWGVEDLPPTEAARLLGNRAAGLLLSVPTPEEQPDPHERDLQATKAALAAMDAILLSRRHYHAQLRERLKLTRDHPHHGIFRTAVAWKLDPSHRLPEDWWGTTARALLSAVDETGARSVSDGLVEHAMHVVLARRVRHNPSQRVREAAWDLLRGARWPDGPVVEAPWRDLKPRFFAARAKTLQ